MKAIIIDDEPKAVKSLVTKLKRHKSLQLVGTASTAAKGMELIAEVKPDVMFLDVELPDMSGIDFISVAEGALDGKCRIVMYTAHDKYMLPSFRNEAFDFLTKPLDPDELEKVVERLERKCGTNDEPKPTVATDNTDNNRLLRHTCASDIHLVRVKDVGFFQYNHDARAWEVIVAGLDTPIRLKRTANNEALLGASDSFVQVSQKFIVNVNYLLEVRSNQCRFYPPFGKYDYVKVGRFYRRKLMERLGL